MSSMLFSLFDFYKDAPLTFGSSEKECIEETIEVLVEDLDVDLTAATHDADRGIMDSGFIVSGYPPHYFVLDALRCILDRDYQEAACALLTLLKQYYKEQS